MGDCGLGPGAGLSRLPPLGRLFASGQAGDMGGGTEA